ncbi:MAG: hypothetical protein ACREU2_16045 [Steroidobacteraceae bacterium]
MSLRLQDAAGQKIGAISIEFRLQPGQTRAGVIDQASKIARQLEAASFRGLPL